MIFTTHLKNPSEWQKTFCWLPVTETIVNEDRSVTLITYWLTGIERRLMLNSMTGLRRWDYRKSSVSDAGVNAV
jgi:hypothetical protein